MKRSYRGESNDTIPLRIFTKMGHREMHQQLEGCAGRRVWLLKHGKCYIMLLVDGNFSTYSVWLSSENEDSNWFVYSFRFKTFSALAFHNKAPF